MAILDISEAAGDVMLDAVAKLASGGSLELLSPDSELLVSLALTDPEPAVDGELVLNANTGVASATGEARFGRVAAADGTEIFAFDVGPEGSDCTFKLTPTMIHAGQDVRLRSFRLVLP